MSHIQRLLDRAKHGAGASLIVRRLGAERIVVLIARDGLITVPGGKVSFRHPLPRSAAYDTIDPAEQREAHKALAEAVGLQRPDQVAWHLAGASTNTRQRHTHSNRGGCQVDDVDIGRDPSPGSGAVSARRCPAMLNAD